MNVESLKSHTGPPAGDCAAKLLASAGTPQEPSAVHVHSGGTVPDDDEEEERQLTQQPTADDETTPEQDEIDRRSVYVGNVDYGATPPELQEHFKNCGAINRITIMVDRYTGHPKGYAYIEFQEESAIPNAVSLNESSFRDRPLKVTVKRKNVPGYSAASRMRGGKPMRGAERGGRIGIRGRGRG